MNARQQVLEKWNQLPESDKNIIRFYMQLPPEDLVIRAERFGDMAFTAKTNSDRKEFVKQAELYGIAYFLKEKKIPVKGGTRKQRKQKGKQRKTKTKTKTKSVR